MMPFGTKIMPGEKWSSEYPGMIEMPDGRLRRRGVYVDGQEKRYSANHYFLRVSCANCGKAHLQNQTNAKRGYRAFCSGSCKSSKHRSETVGNIMLKKREHGDGRHVLVKQPDHPRANRHGYVYEHILIAGLTIGREIKPEERVHHINCVKSDNRTENLFVCANDREHFLIHGSLNKCVSELIEMGVLEFDAIEKTYRVRRP